MMDPVLIFLNFADGLTEIVIAMNHSKLPFSFISDMIYKHPELNKSTGRRIILR
jgi:hypothetical protein